MRILGFLVILFLLAGCISNMQETNENNRIKIIGEKIYNESEETTGAKEENVLITENESTNKTETNISQLNMTNETFETEESENYSENEQENIQGTYFGNDMYVLVLRDISMQQNENGYCALFEVVSAQNGSGLQKMQVCPGEDATWISPDGHVYRIKVFETAAGYSAGARWAKVIIYD